MRAVVILLRICAAAALQPAFMLRYHHHKRTDATWCGVAAAEQGITDLVAVQAAEIAELRSKVEALQRERGDQLVAGSSSTTRRRTQPKKKGTSRVPVYKLYGDLPAGYDAAPVERLLAKRVSARFKKHYSEADRLQKRIMRMGIRLDDRQRTWSLQPGWEALHQQLSEEDEQSWRQQQRLQQELEGSIQSLFAWFDQDGNGLIDRDEFRLVMQVLAIPSSTLDYDATFDQWDTDGSGGLDFKEMRKALVELHKANPELHLLETADVTASFLANIE